MPRKRRDYRKVPSKHSARVIARNASAVDLAASLAAQGDTVAAGLEAELRCVLRDGEEMPDLRFLIELLERRVELARETLDRADEKRFLEETRLSVARREAVQAHGELHAEAVEVRKSLVHYFGSKPARRWFGLSERTPRGKTDLAYEARSLVERLSHAERKLPGPERPGLRADPEGWVDALRTPLERLESVLGEIAARQVKVVDGVADCQQAVKSFDATFLHVARAAEAIFVLAGQPELARRLRPARKRARGRSTSESPVRVAWLSGLAKVRLGLASFWQWLGSLLGISAAAAFRRPKLSKTGVPALAGRFPPAEID